MSGGDIILDLSRLISRADRPTPTGIDRVELAYARHLAATVGDRLRFAALTPLGWVGAVPRAAGMRYVQALERAWRSEPVRGASTQDLGWSLTLQAIAGGEAGLRPRRGARGRSTYLLVSHHHLEKPACIRRVLHVTGGRFVALVHDLIPIVLPEYQRPGVAATHERRMATLAEMAHWVIVNSEDTAEALRPHLARGGRDVPLIAAALGVDIGPISPPIAPDPLADPYFVCVSTIEPRKNHLLLFNIWRRMAMTRAGGPPPPHLHVVGFRGWHNEAALDVIERSTTVRPLLTEHSGLSDPQMARLIAGARALLMPSFAEGYGLPIAEALAVGAPVLCSDLPAFRDVGGDVPEYIDPLDGPAWLQAVRDYAAAASPRREAQLGRLTGWTPPSWDAHFARVDPMLLRDG